MLTHKQRPATKHTPSPGHVSFPSVKGSCHIRQGNTEGGRNPVQNQVTYEWCKYNDPAIAAVRWCGCTGVQNIRSIAFVMGREANGKRGSGWHWETVFGFYNRPVAIGGAIGFEFQLQIKENSIHVKFANLLRVAGSNGLKGVQINRYRYITIEARPISLI